MRQIFFDLDGTLHQQDLFGSFIRYLIKKLPVNAALALCLVPPWFIGVCILGRNDRRPMSLLLWALTVGHKETMLKTLEKQFIDDFKDIVTPFPVVQERLAEYLGATDTQIWLVTGSPETLVTGVYQHSFFLPKVKLVGSLIQRRYGGWILARRCLGEEKVRQLEARLDMPLHLFSGYSDSIQDDPVLRFCERRWRVSFDGHLRELE